MKRRKEKPTAILSGDIHLRDDQPECRTDNYWEAQATKIQFIRELQIENDDIPLLVAGDLFHKWNPSYELVSWAIQNLPRNLLVIAGNHDLKNNTMDLIGKTAINLLKISGKIELMSNNSSHYMSRTSSSCSVFVHGMSLGEDVPKFDIVEDDDIRIVLAHMMVWKGEVPYPGAPSSGESRKVLKKLSEFDLIVTGDNHIPFVDEDNSGRKLVNSGSIMRMTAGQVSHTPRVYLWYAGSNEVEPVYLPIEKGVINREHIDKKKVRDDRIDAYTDRLREDVEIGLDFRQNMKEYIQSHRVRKGVRNIINEVVE